MLLNEIQYAWRGMSQKGRVPCVSMQARSLPRDSGCLFWTTHVALDELEVGALLQQSHPHPLNAVTSGHGREGEFLVDRELRHVGRRRSGHPPCHIREREVQLSQLAEESPDGGIELLVPPGQHWQ